MGPKPKKEVDTRKLIETGDPDFPFLYEATPSEINTLHEQFGVMP